MSKSHIDDVRNILMDTLKDLRDRNKPMDIDRARAVSQVASTLIDTARVEISYIKEVGMGESQFLNVKKTHHLPAPGGAHDPFRRTKNELPS